MELVVKKCDVCGALVKVVSDGNITCCDGLMRTLIPNSVDAAIEKHVPVVEKNGDMIKIVVNHVMESDHYICWIAFVTPSKDEIIYFNPGEKCEVEFKCESNSKVYAYCNKHELWVQDVI